MSDLAEKIRLMTVALDRVQSRSEWPKLLMMINQCRQLLGQLEMTELRQCHLEARVKLLEQQLDSVAKPSAAKNSPKKYQHFM